MQSLYLMKPMGKNSTCFFNYTNENDVCNFHAECFSCRPTWKTQSGPFNPFSLSHKVNAKNALVSITYSIGSSNFGPWACHLASENFLSFAIAIYGGFHCSSVAWKGWVRIRLLSNS